MTISELLGDLLPKKKDLSLYKSPVFRAEIVGEHNIIDEISAIEIPAHKLKELSVLEKNTPLVIKEASKKVDNIIEDFLMDDGGYFGTHCHICHVVVKDCKCGEKLEEMGYVKKEV